MNTYADRARRLMLSLILVLLAAGLCSGQEYRDMDLGVSLYTTSEYGTYWIDVKIWASLSWTPPPERMTHYLLYADGVRFNVYGGGHSGGSGWVVQESFPVANSAQMEEWVQGYFNKRHTFRVVALPYNTNLPQLYDELTYIPPDVLRVENRVLGFSGVRNLTVEISHRQGAAESIDENDAPYAAMPVTGYAKIVSIISDPDEGSERQLEADARPKDSTSDVHLELSLTSISGEPITLLSPARNELRFALPGAAWGNVFGVQPLTIQRRDPCDPSRPFPVYDVRMLIAKNDGILPLPNLQGLYNSGEPYAWFKLSFTRKASIDFNGDGRLDLRDFAVLAAGWKTVGSAFVDIGGPQGNGIPDGRSDARDLLAFCWEWAGQLEGFESGRFGELGWITAGWPPWAVTSWESHYGQYSAQAGRIRNGEVSTLMVTVDCVPGKISFWRKVSSQSDSDFLRFRIGSEIKGKWSGELGWEKVSFSVEAGRKVFAWDYVKDQSESSGDDTAWIDDIAFPLN